jgi:hypothetical protein
MHACLSLRSAFLYSAEYLTVSQLLEDFPAFCGTHTFITVCTRLHHMSLSRASPQHLIFEVPV